jgi:hypothetical protein
MRFSKIKDLVFNIFKKKNTTTVEEKKPEVVDTPSKHDREYYISRITYDGINKPDIVCGENNDLSLLILDDIEMAYSLYKIDFSRIKSKHEVEVCDKVKVINALGTKAGVVAYKYIAIDGNKIDYAILDLTLGYVIKLSKGDYIELDGVDIAIAILKGNPDAKIIFSTVHTLNKTNPTVKYYHDKFREETGLELEDYYLNKNGSRTEVLYELIFGE